MGTVKGIGLVSSRSTGAFVHAVGMRARLWPGKIRIRYGIPFRCIRPKTLSSLPYSGWWGRVTVTFSGTSMWVV